MSYVQIAVVVSELTGASGAEAEVNEKLVELQHQVPPVEIINIRVETTHPQVVHRCVTTITYRQFDPGDSDNYAFSN